MKLQVQTLILVRHAIALDREIALRQGLREAERPLTEEGVRKFQKQVKKNRKAFAETELFVTSSYVRAADTLDLLLQGLECETAKVEVSKLIEPEKRPALFVNWLKERTEKNVAVVSHEPFISNFLNHFLGADVSFMKIRKGAIVVVRYQADEEMFKLTGLF